MLNRKQEEETMTAAKLQEKKNLDHKFGLEKKKKIVL